MNNEKKNYIYTDLVVSKNKKKYEILKNNKKIGIKSEIVRAPFGIEKYNNKYIINIEFTGYKENNNVYNFLNKIKQMDYFFERIKWDKNIKKEASYITEEFIEEIKDKEYKSCIKNRPNNYDPLLRVYIMEIKQKMITKFINKEKQNIIELNKIKEMKGEYMLLIDKIWINKKNYGLTILLKKFEEK